MIEVNCETDFVTKADDFKLFAAALGRCVLHHRPADIAALAQVPLVEGGDDVGHSVQAPQQITQNRRL
ncbi:MAG TPA: hypothetical protein VHH94_04740 [Gammaproteobacteria bacterium]|nr:hypothetical protein [Gammaproteobacteria bacterium]